MQVEQASRTTTRVLFVTLTGESRSDHDIQGERHRAEDDLCTVAEVVTVDLERYVEEAEDWQTRYEELISGTEQVEAEGR